MEKLKILKKNGGLIKKKFYGPKWKNFQKQKKKFFGPKMGGLSKTKK